MRICACVVSWVALFPLLACAEDTPAPVPVQEAAARMTVPEGFKVTLFAGEPDVVQPMAITFDDRGRAWVVECVSYPKWLPVGSKGTDRVIILDDQNGDGKFDKKTVFMKDGLNYSGVEYGFGGIWVTAIPYLLFIPDANQDDIPDGPPQIVLDGWDTQAKHNVINGLVWGPDGWLYGCNGILSNSKVGAPGTPDDQRTAINCGIWRYHPIKKKFEAFAHGTTNPWGLAFDERGEAFLTNCVIEHVFHVVPGARFKRMFGTDFNPYTFELMQTCADHIHWAGGTWEGSRTGVKHGEAGGGHAHSGALIYLGDNFPQEYRGSLLTANIHGNRLNRDTFERKGSGYVAEHAPDFLMAHDPWFRGIAVRAGADGGVYATDWSDTGECHNYVDETTHRENGRIYKVVYGQPKPFIGDLAKLSDTELVKLLTHPNRWFGDHARRLLQERNAKQRLPAAVGDQIIGMLRGKDHQLDNLQLWWAAHVIGRLDEKALSVTLATAETQETVGPWLIRFALGLDKPSPLLLKGISELLAKNQIPASVRLAGASGLQRLPLAQRWPLAMALVKHNDAQDSNLPLMLWYGIEPLIGSADPLVVNLVRQMQTPLLRQFSARRIAVEPKPNWELLAQLFEVVSDDAARIDLLKGLHQGLDGRRGLKLPAEWKGISQSLASSKSPEVTELLLRIAVILGDPNAVIQLHKLAGDPKQQASVRNSSLSALIQVKAAGTDELALLSLNDPAVRGTAIRGLAAFDRPETPTELLGHFASFTPEEKQEAVTTLCSRADYATKLVEAVEEKKLDSQTLTEFDVRQLLRFPDPKLKARVNKAFGSKQPTSEERAKLIAETKTMILAGDAQKADASRGRAVFQKNCATCHTLFGEGKQIGPELTGSQRTELDYILSNVLDPNALVGYDYKITQIVTFDGRSIGGIVKAEDQNTVTIDTANERIVVPKPDIEVREKTNVSMMPEGLLSRLQPQEIRDLVKYLASPKQVPMP